MPASKVSLFLLCLSGSLAFSQVHSATDASAPLGHWQIYGGPTFTGSNPSGATFGGAGGIGFDVAHWVAVMGEFSMVRTTCCGVNNITLTDYMVGPRVGLPLRRSSRVVPFADVLFGGQYLANSSNHHTWYYSSGGGWATAFDGGADVRMTNHFALRAEMGYVFSRFSVAGGTGPVSNSRWRAAPYLVYRF